MPRTFTRPHLVWGWRGTLTNDVDRYIQALNIALEPLGAGRVERDIFRRHFTRSSPLLFSAILGRALTARERKQASIAFETHLARRPPLQLRPGADELLVRLRRSGCTHSVLSPMHHNVLTRQVSDLGVAPLFTRIEGRKNSSIGPWRQPLVDHASALGASIGDRPIVVIADDPGDVRAAIAHHMHAVPFGEGLTHPDVLSQFGLPVATTLAEAAAIAIEYVHTT
ncbi:HAD family hydrolase [Streptomyces tauricus]